jgi:hypothetical protein
MGVYNGANPFLGTSSLAYIAVARLGFVENKAESVGDSVFDLGLATLQGFVHTLGLK